MLLNQLNGATSSSITTIFMPSAVVTEYFPEISLCSLTSEHISPTRNKATPIIYMAKSTCMSVGPEGAGPSSTTPMASSCSICTIPS